MPVITSASMSKAVRDAYHKYFLDISPYQNYERRNEVNNEIASAFPFHAWRFRQEKAWMEISVCAYCGTSLQYTPYPQNGWGDVMRTWYLGTCDRCGGPANAAVKKSRASRQGPFIWGFSFLSSSC